MSYLAHLKRQNHCPSCRWIVKMNGELVREVKLIFNPEEYKDTTRKKYGDKARQLKTRKQLIKILENDKEKRRSKS